jgi:Sulfotransferase domain
MVLAAESGLKEREIYRCDFDCGLGRWVMYCRVPDPCEARSLRGPIIARPDHCEDVMSLKLIGAGLPRTATMTQKVALEMLGIGPCYHMANVWGDLGTVPRWHETFSGRREWEDIFGDFEATVDWPGAFFYRELMEAYPEAKVLLSVRSGESWERSMGNTIWGTFYGDMLVHDLSTAWARVGSEWARYITLMKAMWEKSGLLIGEWDGPGRWRGRWSATTKK